MAHRCQVAVTVGQAVCGQIFSIELAEKITIQVAKLGAQLQTASGKNFWRDGRIQIRRDVHVIRHRDLDAAVG